MAISLGPWKLNWKPRTTLSVQATTPQTVTPLAASDRNHVLARPALRWVAGGRVALRPFDFDADAAAVCSFQPETYAVNFPDFRHTPAFASAFRHDLRRACLDPHNGLFVLDDGRERDNIIGFLWAGIFQNNWTGERYGYINNLYVTPQRRSQGLGYELMKQADDFFRSRGIKRVRLTVTAANASAVALYENSGFKVQRWEMEKEL